MFGLVDAAAIDAALTEAWGTCAPATWNRHLATTRSFVAFARRRGWVGDLVVGAKRRREPADRTGRSRTGSGTTNRSVSSTRLAKSTLSPTRIGLSVVEAPEGRTAKPCSGNSMPSSRSLWISVSILSRAGVRARVAGDSVGGNLDGAAVAS